MFCAGCRCSIAAPQADQRTAGQILAPLSLAIELEGQCYGRLRSSEDFREGVEAFAAKRPQNFRGDDDQLNRSRGVIHPPANVDPVITQPAPDIGPHRMPVIPPPGTPGGNPDVKPK
jgi:hypothetical protein